MAEAVAEEYRSSLADLNFNSKPHINMLTIIAEENIQHAKTIVNTIMQHIKSVPPDLKLPSLYLVDSIMKNVRGEYVEQFSIHMVELFSYVFEKVDEATRSSLYKLRQTWNEILPKTTLYGIDCRVNNIDPAWPITARLPTKSIHVNPKFVSGPASIAAEGLVKESEIKKKQDEMLKLIEEKRKLEEVKMKRLIEEKRAQLRLLEAKKMETLQHVKQQNCNSNVVKQNNQPTSIIHRDPRLKKAAKLLGRDTVKEIEKPNSPLQSVVVIPNTDIKKVDTASKSLTNVSSNKDISISESKTALQNIPPQVPKNVETLTVPTGNISNKKRPLSPEKALSNSLLKKPCTDSSVSNIQPSPTENHQYNNMQQNIDELKKSAMSSVKSNKEVSAAFKENRSSQFTSDQRLPEPALFGSEDKDYRKMQRIPDTPKFETNISQQSNFKISGPAQFQNDRIPNDIPRDVAELQKPVEIQRNNSPISELVSNALLPPKLEGLNINQDIDSRQQTQNNGFTPGKESDIPLTLSFKLDGKDRVIHFIDKRAFAFMDDKEPHELSFIGPEKNVFIEGLPQPLVLRFDGKEVQFDIEGKLNTIQFGTPAREIYINNYPYEMQFGGPPLIIPLSTNKPHRISIDGPPPQVLIGEKPAHDLYEAFNRAKNNVPQPQVTEHSTILPPSTFPSQDVDMRIKIPLKPPPFFEATSEKLKDIDWRSKGPWNPPVNSVQLTTVPTTIEHSAKPIMTNTPFGTESFPASTPFTSAPTSLSQLRNTNSSVPTSHIHHQESNFNQMRPNLEAQTLSNHPAQPLLPPQIRQPGHHVQPLHPSSNIDPSHPVNPLLPPSSMDPAHHIQPLRPPTSLDSAHSIQPLRPPPSIPPALSSLRPPPPLTSSAPSIDIRPTVWKPLEPPPMFPGPLPVIEKKPALLPTPLTPKILPVPMIIPRPPLPMNQPQEVKPPVIDVGSIFEKLVAAGFIAKKPDVSEDSKDGMDSKAEDASKEVVPSLVDFDPKKFKQFYMSSIFEFYKGSQCATCGMRFKNCQGEQYGRHLDWHFRMNRREKDGAKKAFSRKYYYTEKEWIQFAEIEEADERAPSYFKLQDDANAMKKEEVEEILSVRASECETEKCAVCSESFQLFWVEEEEEWHLRHAVRHDDEVYHPACYEDFKKASVKKLDLLGEEEEESDMKTEISDSDISKDEICDSDLPKEEICDSDGPKEEVCDPDLPKDENSDSLKVEVPNEDLSKNEVGASETETLKTDLVIKTEPMDTSENDLSTDPAAPVEETKTNDEDIKVPIKEETTDDKSDIQMNVKDEIVEESVSIKTEPIDGDTEQNDNDTGLSKIIIYMTDDLELEDEPMDIDTPENESNCANKEDAEGAENKSSNSSEPVSELENAKDEEDDFRPPTPDPRFDVQPKVFKGTELSALCTIM